MNNNNNNPSFGIFGLFCIPLQTYGPMYYMRMLALFFGGYKVLQSLYKISSLYFHYIFIYQLSSKTVFLFI